MSSVALYRKYRPLSFSEVIGQEHIVKTLSNQVSLSRISHAYLFTGSRGTGKTTFARIFAKSINCEKPKAGSCCNVCKTCKALSEPTNMDILEIDAASNNKVDEVREIREKVKYMPVSGKYKVYIIDEVHMLTDGAFNALLKTLEEPPAHVVFILATTEVHKLPATILSRCMRFDFRLVPKKQIIELLSKIIKQEKKDAELKAIDYIADAAQGSFRDALSILDTCLTDKKLLYADVLTALGTSNKEQIADFFMALAASDLKAVMQNIDDFVAGGKAIHLVAKDVAVYARDVLSIKLGLGVLVQGAKEALVKMTELAKTVDESLLLVAMREFAKIDQELKLASSPRTVLEITSLKVASLSGEDNTALAARISKLEQKLNELLSGAVTVKKNSGVEGLPVGADRVIRSQDVMGGVRLGASAPTGKDNFQSLAPESPYDPDSTLVPVQSISSAVNKVLGEDAKSVWGRLITYFRKNKNTLIYSLISDFTNYRIVGKDLIIDCDENNYLQFADEKIMQGMQAALQAIDAQFIFKVNKKKGKVDMDAEIARIEKVTGVKPKVKRK